MQQGKPSYVHYIIWQGEAELHILELTSVFHHLSSVGTKQLCALAHLGCTQQRVSKNEQKKTIFIFQAFNEMNEGKTLIFLLTSIYMSRANPLIFYPWL